MRHFIVGGDGKVGTALRRELVARGESFWWSTRKQGLSEGVFLDLARPIKALPKADILYLVAAIPGFYPCEASAESWVVNVDAPIAIAKYYANSAFTVFVSSDAVEWASFTAYGRQKMQVESYMHTINAAIVRASHIGPGHFGKFAHVLADVGMNGKPGVTRWAMNQTEHDAFRSDHGLRRGVQRVMGGGIKLAKLIGRKR